MEEEFFFEKLTVYQESRALVKATYALVRKFPEYERYALCDQLRRAIVSVPSNIAEGISRVSVKEKLHFLDISFGSLMESYCQLQLALDENYITKEDYKSIKHSFFTVGKLLNSFKASIAKKGNETNN